ncbi:MAG: aminopeptidase P family protein, partial [Planctomycetes bacterium]|nr:aminopeptidase P family protein [Planctomycetota bacterium]
KENLRYVSNYWPIFERGMLIIPKDKEPMLLVAPEGEEVAREMSVWPEIRNIKDFTCVTVPDEIEYQYARYSSFVEIAKDIKPNRLGIIGLDALSPSIFSAIRDAFKNKEMVDYNKVIYSLRLIKSEEEIISLKRAWQIADKAYEIMMKKIKPGLKEVEICAEAEYVARKEGAEDITFFIFGSGERTNTIVGRPTEKIIKEGDMVMADLAIQYEGYVATLGFPFVVGEPTLEQNNLIKALIMAEYKALPLLKSGQKMKNFVKVVKDHFRQVGLDKYDLYPPLHGCGCAEAESPYPNETTEDAFQEGMTVNTDISLFGTPCGSNRLEEGFIIRKEGPESMSQYITSLRRRLM